MTGNATSAAILAQMSRGPNASMDAKWVTLVQDGLPDTSLHHLVVSNGTPTAAKKMRDMY
jgi:hypothetical protein